ncbi:MAG: 50S ribosomal protein L1 [Chloroflexi bacterium]|uniref:Large ribosomal subunit protein uL1 n=1 Tax=Candidatus Chlorohelix allophototropha TaxID=3003348 RepID=A0A8T7M8J3_9CHLR|nr:50S ribosomal protein L1 [Chloroflexota bacterium]WJW68393.1 50S ribosomal protein L1 [Chloroflexota bacterium L227-S17]
MDHGKKYTEVAKQVDSKKTYKLDEAIAILKKTSYVKFDPTIELHFRLGIDPRHADQQVRSTAVLPHGTGKQVRILVFTQGEGEILARQAGADFVGSDDLVKQIEGGWTEFDVAVATPEQMGKVGKLGKILGRRGLMPNPKSGTICQPSDLPRVIQETRRGKVEFRNEPKAGLVHVGVGKLSFSEQQIRENVMNLIEGIVRNKPTGAKGVYIRSITITSTMGPGIHLEVNPILTEVGSTN